MTDTISSQQDAQSLNIQMEKILYFDSFNENVMAVMPEEMVIYLEESQFDFSLNEIITSKAPAIEYASLQVPIYTNIPFEDTPPNSEIKIISAGETLEAISTLDGGATKEALGLSSNAPIEGIDYFTQPNFEQYIQYLQAFKNGESPPFDLIYEHGPPDIYVQAAIGMDLLPADTPLPSSYYQPMLMDDETYMQAYPLEGVTSQLNDIITDGSGFNGDDTREASEITTNVEAPWPMVSLEASDLGNQPESVTQLSTQDQMKNFMNSMRNMTSEDIIEHISGDNAFSLSPSNTNQDNSIIISDSYEYMVSDKARPNDMQETSMVLPESIGDFHSLYLNSTYSNGINPFDTTPSNQALEHPQSDFAAPSSSEMTDILMSQISVSINI